ncbi:MAG: tRNA (adenosine(37)-N6)-threonylcarbamoyltransferase complex ATPase subunit type 1 TsaE [Pseudomonadota bacterium]
MVPGQTTLTFPTEADTARFAARLGRLLHNGDTLLLEGPIGAGKSAFARALIRSLAGAEIEVPSPTFTLVQTYELPQGEVWHCDLYRLSQVDEVLELGLEDAFSAAICLIEWPDRLGDAAPPSALRLTFAARDDHHAITFAEPPAWRDRLKDLSREA